MKNIKTFDIFNIFNEGLFTDRNKWLNDNFEKYREISKKEDFHSKEYTTKEDDDFMDKYEKIYDKVHKKERDEFYKNAPLSHKGTSRRERRNRN